jgi:hypothetical protein
MRKNLTGPLSESEEFPPLKKGARGAFPFRTHLILKSKISN